MPKAVTLKNPIIYEAYVSLVLRFVVDMGLGGRWIELPPYSDRIVRNEWTHFSRSEFTSREVTRVLGVGVSKFQYLND